MRGGICEILGAITQAQYQLAWAGRLCLKLKKAMYGLCDAPALWQLALQHHVTKDMGGYPCLHDACHFYFRNHGELSGEATAHVDDTCFSGKQRDLDARRQMIEKRFGSVSRQVLPFQHVGVTYEGTRTGGFRFHQEHIVWPSARRRFHVACLQSAPSHHRRSHSSEPF